MSRLVLLLALAAIVPACPPSPAPPPRPDVADAAPSRFDAASCEFPPGACGDACRNLARLGCPNNSPGGMCCAAWLCSLPAYAIPGSTQFKCMASAKTSVDARECGVFCQ